MRIDKLTTKLQEALADAQSLALKHDNASIESAHLVLALLEQHDSVGPLLQRSGVDTKALATGVLVVVMLLLGIVCLLLALFVLGSRTAANFLPHRDWRDYVLPRAHPG